MHDKKNLTDIRKEQGIENDPVPVALLANT